jgi:hypothetical protein
MNCAGGETATGEACECVCKLISGINLDQTHVTILDRFMCKVLGDVNMFGELSSANATDVISHSMYRVLSSAGPGAAAGPPARCRAAGAGRADAPCRDRRRRRPGRRGRRSSSRRATYTGVS